jgi:hypothetical protein
MNKFCLEDGHTDIAQILYEIPDKELVLPPFSPAEFSEICKFNATTIIASDTLTISPTLPGETIKKLAVSFNFKDPYYPLLNADVVRSAIKIKLTRPDKIRLQLHKLVVEIFDYEHMVFQVFFHSSLSYMLKFDLSFNGMKRLFAAAFPNFDSILVHSSGIILKDRAALFMAPDEGGKSTAVGLGKKENILCDDFNVLSRRKGICKVHSTPWGRLCNGPVSAPLGGFFFLEKAKVFSLRSINAQEAVINIWNENFRFLKNLPKEMKVQAFNTLFDICREVPAYIMGFPKDHIDWQAIDKAMT